MDAGRRHRRRADEQLDAEVRIPLSRFRICFEQHRCDRSGYGWRNDLYAGQICRQYLAYRLELSVPLNTRGGKTRRRYSSPASPLPTKAIRMKLVAPGVPSGTPATTITRSPDLAKPSLKARRQA